MKKRKLSLRIWAIASLFLVVSILGVFAPVANSESRAWTSDTAISAQQLGSVTVEFRRGTNGYGGVKDTFLAAAEPTVAKGADPTLQVKENQPYRRSLIHFDLTSIPPNATITNAWLDLFVNYRSSTTSANYGFYYLLRPWDEGAATWQTDGYGSEWVAPGAGGMGNDYEAGAFASSPLSTVNAYNRVGVLTAVQRWVREPDQNYGMLIMGSSSVDLRFWSSESPREVERPRLVVTYEMMPTETPSPTISPTVGPSPTFGPSPTSASVIYSTGMREAFDDAAEGTCTVAYPDAPGSAEVVLAYKGTPLYAKLSFWYSSNNTRDHAIQINGTPIGRLPGANYRTKCVGTTLASYAELAFDPSLLRSGVNMVTILADRTGETDGWAMQYPRIEIGGAVQGSQIQVVRLQSSYDRTSQRAMIQKPAGYVPGAPVPLVLAFHGWGGRDFDALKPLAAACSARGWLLAAPDTRNSAAHTPSKAVQRDVLDLMKYMTASPEYAVDTSRVYLVGNSMGGMMAAVIAAKYPDRFAGLVENKGPMRLDSWFYEMEEWRRAVLYSELNGTPNTTPFSYERVSATMFAPNLRYIPTLIIHGTQDTVVPYHHATDLESAMVASGATNVRLYSYQGGHYNDHPDWGVERILDFFSDKVAVSRPLTLTVHTDEPNTYYWLGIGYNTSDHWSRVSADLDPLRRTVTLDVHDERVPSALVYVTLDLDKMGLPTNVPYTVEDTNQATGAYSQYQVQAGQTLQLTVERDRHHLVVYPFAAALPQTFTFRQGEGGYDGMQDTYIETYSQKATHGSDDRVAITNSGYRTVLMRFDLSTMPSGISVKAAQLKIYAHYRWGSGETLEVAAHGLLHGWDANEATWLQASDEEAWAKPGAWGADQDYAWTASSQAVLNQTSTWYGFNVTNLVQQWLQDPASNYGLLLRGGAGLASFQLSSSESAILANRPVLEIVYVQPTPSPTPTGTLTPVPSLTPTGMSKDQRVFLPSLCR